MHGRDGGSAHRVNVITPSWLRVCADGRVVGTPSMTCPLAGEVSLALVAAKVVPNSEIGFSCAWLVPTAGVWVVLGMDTGQRSRACWVRAVMR